jgi:hypothetical protein
MLAVLDANRLIDAFEPSSHAHSSVQRVLQAHSHGCINLSVSLHTLSEIASPVARELAERLSRLPHFPIGVWTDQVASWDQLGGTWADPSGRAFLNIGVRVTFAPALLPNTRLQSDSRAINGALRALLFDSAAAEP